MEALTTQLEKLSREKPVLMIFEDMKWVDPTSLGNAWSNRRSNPDT